MAHERRLFLNLGSAAPECVGQEFQTSESDSRHLRTVLRVTEGFPLTVVDTASGAVFDAVVASALPDAPVMVKIVRPSSGTSTKGATGSVVFALGKNPVNDLVCEKLAELGVPHLIFWQAERSLVRLTEEELPKKRERWQRIAESAAKQSNKDYLMHVQVARNEDQLNNILQSLINPNDALLLCSLAPHSAHPRNISRPRGLAHLLIGPAGDLTAGEETRFAARGFVPITLGPCLFRAETAAIVAVATIEALWG